MTKILAAVDNSPAAAPVLSVAADVARIARSSVDAVHVDEGGSRTARGMAEAAGLPLRILDGHPSPVLVGEASKPGVLAIVMGMRGTSVGHPAGHVSEAVITSTDRPVVLVPPETPVPFSLRRVLVPMEKNPATAATLGATIELVHSSDIEVAVLHVYDQSSVPAYEDQPQYETEAWAREFLARYIPLPPEQVRLELRVGLPADQVLSVAREQRIDMIALGWGRRLSPGRAGLVRPVLERSAIPVLLVGVLPGVRPLSPTSATAP